MRGDGSGQCVVVRAPRRALREVHGGFRPEGSEVPAQTYKTTTLDSAGESLRPRCWATTLLTQWVHVQGTTHLPPHPRNIDVTPTALHGRTNRLLNPSRPNHGPSDTGSRYRRSPVSTPKQRDSPPNTPRTMPSVCTTTEQPCVHPPTYTHPRRTVIEGKMYSQRGPVSDPRPYVLLPK